MGCFHSFNNVMELIFAKGMKTKLKIETFRIMEYDMIGLN